jgi:hypothetical protein
VVISDQHLPILSPTHHTVSDDFASAFKPNLRNRAPKDVSAGIDRIGHQPVDCIVARRAPLHGPPLRTIDGNRQVNPLLPQPQDELAHATNLAELAEHQRQRIADPQVRVHFHAIISPAPVTDRDCRMQLAPRRFQAQRLA